MLKEMNFGFIFGTSIVAVYHVRTNSPIQANSESQAIVVSATD